MCFDFKMRRLQDEMITEHYTIYDLIAMIDMMSEDLSTDSHSSGWIRDYYYSQVQKKNREELGDPND